MARIEIGRSEQGRERMGCMTGPNGEGGGGSRRANAILDAAAIPNLT